MFDWNDLRYFLAVARHGSTIAAAKALKTSQSTVQRRLAELERKIGRPLVQRHANGYRLTEFGEQLLPHAERVEAAVETLDQQRATLERGEIGVIRLTCPEPIMARLRRSPFLDRFHERHPGLRVEFVMSDKYLDLARGDADVALRSGDTDDDVLVGRKVADSFWAVYGTPAYLAEHGKPLSVDDLKSHAMIGLDESMAGHRAATWLREAAPGAELVARCNSVLGLVSAAKSGIGLAPLPTALGDAEPELTQVLGPIPALTRSWRLLTHPDVRKTPRVSAFFDFVNDEVDTLRPILSG
ncbi:MAG TPA: LysR family transcriptional regulator [Xanthobacteraceae bacterium]|nr:LysR family transcriptional regulator [Xanthobacteraceae bacterium]